MTLLDDLNESQRKAVEYIDGPSLVVAGAGSGSRHLQVRIAWRSSAKALQENCWQDTCR